MSNVELQTYPFNISHDWQWARLGDVCNFLDSRRKPINEHERSLRIAGKDIHDLFPYYGANGQVGWIDGYLFDEELILLAEDGGYFGSEIKPIAYAIKGKSWVNNHAHVLQPKIEIIDPNYCLYSLLIRPDVGSLVAGSTRAKLNQAEAYKLLIPLPPLDEQRRIAAILAEQMVEVEQARAAAESELEAAQELITPYLYQIFESNEAQSWPNITLGSIAFDGIHNGAFKQRHEFGQGVPFVNVSDLFRDFTVDFSGVERVSASVSEIAQHGLCPGDLLFCRSSVKREGIGHVCVVGDIPEPSIFDCHIMRVRPIQERIHPKYIAYYWSRPEIRATIIDNARTATMTTINQKDLAAVKIPLAPIETQLDIIAELDRIRNASQYTSTLIKQKLSAINELPPALLRKAFNGEL